MKWYYNYLMDVAACSLDRARKEQNPRKARILYWQGHYIKDFAEEYRWVHWNLY